MEEVDATDQVVEAQQTPILLAEAPSEEPAPAPAPAEAAPEAAPPAASPLDQWVDKTEARLAALEGAAHSNHNIDQSVIDQLVALVLERLSASLSKHLG